MHEQTASSSHEPALAAPGQGLSPPCTTPVRCGVTDGHARIFLKLDPVN